jgi:hypothetical protein
MHLLASVGCKKKRKFYCWFFVVLFSKGKVVVSCENLDNSTYACLVKPERYRSVRLSDLVYVQSKSPNCPSCVFSDLKSN